MTTQVHLAHGIGAGRRHPDREHVQLRDLELSRTATRRVRRGTWRLAR